MLQGQMQPSGVLDKELLHLIRETPRALFVSPMHCHFAFADVKLPLPDHTSMLTPCEEARIMTLLQPTSEDTVLEVGTGSGYLTALLAKCARHIYSVDINPQTTQKVAKCLAGLNINNATLVTDDAIKGWHAQSDYDIILVNGSIPFIPKALCQHLAVGGRLFAIVGQAPVMNATLIKRLDESNWEPEVVFNTCQTRLANSLPEESFSF